jgi:hypothetical protein
MNSDHDGVRGVTTKESLCFYKGICRPIGTQLGNRQKKSDCRYEGGQVAWGVGWGGIDVGRKPETKREE